MTTTPQESIVSCVQCKKGFKSAEALELHTRIDHPQYVQTIFTPGELEAIRLLALIGSSTFLSIQNLFFPDKAAEELETFLSQKVVELMAGYVSIPLDTRNSALSKLTQVCKK